MKKYPEIISCTSMVYLHAGKFHADDCMALALLLECSPNLMWERISNPIGHIVPGSIMVDIGLGEFDHHQEVCKKHGDGTPYCAASLIWEQVAEYLFPDQQSRNNFYWSYLRPIELQDNGVLGASGKPCKNPFNAMISSFVPNWDSDETMDEAFEKALHICQRVLKNEIGRCKSKMRAEKTAVSARADNDGFIVINRYMPIQTLLMGKGRVLCFPSNRNSGNWTMLPIPANIGGRPEKRFFPKEWYYNAPEGMVFIHKGLFTSEWETIEAAKKAMANARLSDRC